MPSKGYRRTITIDFDYGQVVGGTVEINKQLKILDSEFNKSAQEANRYGGNLDKLGVEHDKLSNQVGLQAQKVDAIKTKYEKAKKQLEEHRKEMSDNNNASKEAQTDLKNLEKRVDNLRIEYNKAETQLSKFTEGLENSTQNLKKQESALGQAANKVNDFAQKSKEAGVDLEKVADIAQKAGAVLVGIGAAALKTYMSFDESMAKVRSIADTTQVSMEDLEKGVISLSDKYGIASKEMAEGLYDVVSASVETADSLGFLENATRLAVTGFTDVSTAVDILSSFTNAYNLSQEEQIALTDKLIKAQKEGKFTIDELGSSFGAIAGIASTAKVPIDEMLAMLATTTSQGVGASEAITGLKGVLAAVIKPTAQAKEEAEKLGINFSITALRSKGLAGFLEDVTKKTKGNEESLAQLFGRVEGLNTVLIKANSGAEKFSTSLNEISNSTGTADEALSAIDSHGKQFSVSINQMQNSLIKLGDALSPVLSLLAGIFEVISNIPTPVSTAVVIFGAIILVMGTLTKSILSMSAAFVASGMSASVSAAGLWQIIGVLVIIAAVVAVVLALFLSFSKGTKSATDSVKSMTNDIQTQANALPSKLPDTSKIGRNATGTTYWKGGLTYANEDGDEIFDLPTGTRIIPHDIAMEMARSGQLNNVGGSTQGDVNNYYFIVQADQINEVNKLTDMINSLKPLKNAWG